MCKIKCAKTSMACWGRSIVEMRWYAWYLLVAFGQVAFTFSGLLSSNHLCLNSRSLLSCFNEFFEQIHEDKLKTVLKDLPCISCWLQQDLQPCLQARLWDRNSMLFFCTTYASKVQVDFGEHKQSIFSLKVEKHSSAWIPVQILEEGFKDKKISWCLYVLGTPSR